MLVNVKTVRPDMTLPAVDTDVLLERLTGKCAYE